MQTFYMNWACSQRVLEDLIASGYGVWAKKADDPTLLGAYIRAVKLSQAYAARTLENARKGGPHEVLRATLAVADVLNLVDALEARFLAGREIAPSDLALHAARDGVAMTRTVYAQRGIMDFVLAPLLAHSRTVLEPRDWLVVYLGVPESERALERGLPVWLEHDFSQVDGSYLDDAKALRLPLPV